MLRGGFGSRRCVVSAVSVNTRSKEKQLAYCAELSTSLRSLMHSSFDLIDGAHRLRRLSNVLNCFDYPKVFMRVIPLSRASAATALSAPITLGPCGGSVIRVVL